MSRIRLSVKPFRRGVKEKQHLTEMRNSLQILTMP